MFATVDAVTSFSVSAAPARGPGWHVGGDGGVEVAEAVERSGGVERDGGVGGGDESPSGMLTAASYGPNRHPHHP
jgi:hypothetical protein